MLIFHFLNISTVSSLQKVFEIPNSSPVARAEVDNEEKKSPNNFQPNKKRLIFQCLYSFFLLKTSIFDPYWKIFPAGASRILVTCEGYMFVSHTRPNFCFVPDYINVNHLMQDSNSQVISGAGYSPPP